MKPSAYWRISSLSHPVQDAPVGCAQGRLDFDLDVPLFCSADCIRFCPIFQYAPTNEVLLRSYGAKESAH